MNTLPITCILLLTLLLSTTLFASSMKVFFTDDELTEMGVHINSSSLEREEAIA
jgi:hypothetical protein